MKTMKKNFIYTLCLLLSGALFLNSCEDMLEIETTRVDHEFNDLTLNDSVYSVLGIVKSVQNIADRQVLLGELRGDLVVPNAGKAVVDIQNICNFDFDLENPYLAVKDYYSVINNCNVFLARVDTTIERSNQKLMLREFVAVKSLRAWTYLQLAINYGRIPYFTEPILTHQAAVDVMAQPMKSRDEIVSLLIEDLTPYENPRVYPMPTWKGVKVGGLNMATANLFMPIRPLLAELHLWRGNAGDYKIAANYLYQALLNTPANANASLSRQFYDFTTHVDYSNETHTDLRDNYGKALYSNSVLTDDGIGLFGVPMETSTSIGMMSGLNDIFAPMVVGAAQVAAAPGYVALSNRQVYTEYDDATPNIEPKYYIGGDVYKGDLRRYSVTGSQYNKESDEYFSNVIAKHNYGGSFKMNGLPSITNTQVTDHITFYRAEMLYARFAEALIGMAAIENIPNADLLALVTLASGLNEDYAIQYNHVPADTTYVVDAEGNPVLNAAGSDSIVVTPASYDEVSFDFSELVEDGNALKKNRGLHSRGSGFTAKNIYYLPDEYNIAKYYDLILEETEDTIAYSRSIERVDTINYVTDLLIDELALEFCFEGNRFGDLIRFAKFAEKRGVADWKDVLAKRVAGRAIENEQNVYSKDFELDNSLYNMLLNEENWYLPLPGSVKVSAPEAE